MQLTDYPRPPLDNGRGIHWAPIVQHPSGSVLDYWLHELWQMHVTWVKLFDDGHGSSLDLCQRLLDQDMMPIVRFYHPGQNPYRFSTAEVEAVHRLARAGVRYFEINNEPDLPSEWVGGQRPDSWLLSVAENFLADARDILDAGGLPGLPAMAFSGQIELAQAILERGGGEIFAAGAWVALHNYVLNRPLDYPFDPVNQEGRPLTQTEYNAYTSWEWDGHAIAEINRWREDGKRPGAEIADDPLCFNAYRQVGEGIADLLGYPLPIISTEGGAVTGWKDDRRYPRLSPRLAAEMTVQMNHFIATAAPPWYFAICHWLLANRQMDPSQPDFWESQAWYTDWWNDTFGLSGVLPVVEQVKEIGPLPRLNMIPGEAQAFLSGQIQDEAGTPIGGVTVTLRQGNQDICEVVSNKDGRLTFGILPAGAYELFVADRGQAGRLDLAPGDMQEIALTLHPLMVEPEPIAETPTFAYELSSREMIHLDTAEMGLTVQGKVIDENGDGIAGIPLRLQWQDVEEKSLSLQTETGSIPEEDAGFFRFLAPTNHASLQVIAGDGQSEPLPLSSDEGDTPYRWEVIFRRRLTALPRESAQILGRVPGGRVGQEVVLTGSGGERRTTLDEEGRFSFSNVPAGTYKLELQYVGVMDYRLAVSKGQTVNVEFPMRSVIQGLVKGASPDMTATLVAETHHWTRAIAISTQGQFRFAELPAGRYHVCLDDYTTDSLFLDGLQAYRFPLIDLRPPDRATLQVTVRAENGDLLPEQGVTVQRGDEVIAQGKTALNGRVKFEQLSPGEYQVSSIEGKLTVAVTLANDEQGEVLLQPSKEEEVQAGETVSPGGEMAPERAAQKPVSIPTEPMPVPTEPMPEPTTMARPAVEKPLRLYILFPVNQVSDSRARFLLAQTYIRRERAGSSGFNPEVAFLAQKVVLLGSEEDFPPDFVSALRASGSQVELLSSDLFELEQQLREKEQNVL